MGLFNHFPYTNFHDLNLDWLLERVKGMDTKLTDMEALADTLNAEVVVFTTSNGTSFSKTAGKTAYELYQAVQNGKMLVCKIVNSTTGTVEYAIGYTASMLISPNAQIQFSLAPVISTPMGETDVNVTYDRVLSLTYAMPRDTVAYSKKTVIMQTVEEE